MKRFLRAAFLVLALGLVAGARAQSAGRDPLPPFQAWLKKLVDGRATIDSRSIDGLRLAVGDLRIAWAIDPGRGREIGTALLDLLGLCLERGGRDPEGSPMIQMRDIATETLRAHFDPEFLRWLTYEVLSLPVSQPVSRRAATLWILNQRHEPQILLPLLGCARERDPTIRRAALDALLGWEDESVHAVFLDELARALEAEGKRSGAVSWLAEKHFTTASIPHTSRLLPRLAALVRRGLSSTDWREASRAIALSRPLDNESAIPCLIEALSFWKARAESGAQALRIEFEIQRALEDRSGRKLGLSPDNWLAWWDAVRRGEIKGVSPTTVGGVVDSTRASFFGLRPMTDRVTFVIDRSGSMTTPFGTAADPQAGPTTGPPAGKPGAKPKAPEIARTRWDEAVNQLLGFVDAIGPKARFDVVIFHDYPEMWRPALVLASADEKHEARQWLVGTRPAGGTELKAGIDRALFIQPDGRADLTKLEADTVIVLCDGATAEGPSWVDAFLEHANLEARIVFHCVQIGNQGDGTLEKLARGSGGDFVRVDG